jgi:hypothetical protein
MTWDFCIYPRHRCHANVCFLWWILVRADLASFSTCFVSGCGTLFMHSPWWCSIENLKGENTWKHDIGSYCFTAERVEPELNSDEELRIQTIWRIPKCPIIYLEIVKQLRYIVNVFFSHSKPYNVWPYKHLKNHNVHNYTSIVPNYHVFT